MGCTCEPAVVAGNRAGLENHHVLSMGSTFPNKDGTAQIQFRRGRPPTRLKTPRDTALQRRGMWLPWKKAKKAKTNLELEDYEGLETIAWRMKIIMPNSTFRVAWDWALVRIGSVSNLGFNPATASSQAVAQRLRLRIWLALRSSSFYV